jgi:hypothetical protein
MRAKEPPAEKTPPSPLMRTARASSTSSRSRHTRARARWVSGLMAFSLSPLKVISSTPGLGQAKPRLG